MKDSRAVRDLAALGGVISVGHDAGHAAEASALVTTAAVPADHPELVAARAAGIPVLKRAEALGAWVSRGTVVGIAGTHGKTTTTAMTTEILAGAGMDPTGLVGGRVTGWNGNLRFGGGDLFVVEADEYDRSFLMLSPDVAVITNLEADHLDIYGDLDGVRQGFLDFLAGVRGGGRVIVCSDDHGASAMLPSIGPTGYTYGTSAGSMLRATDVTVTSARTRCKVYEEGQSVGDLELQMGGRHNLLNALGAAAASRALGAEWDDIFRSLAGFAGVGRRLERLGEVGGVRGHAPALRAIAAVTSPTVNCYKRLQIGAGLQSSRSGFTRTPAFISYGDNNRTQMIRTAGPGHCEDRTVSALCNPYLGLAVYLTAGMDGVRRKLDPGEPNLGNLYSRTLAEIESEGIKLLPQTLIEAVSALKDDEVVQQGLGPIADVFIDLKTKEWETFHKQITPWEVREYLTL